MHLLVGLKYDHKLWAEMWPRIMANTIEACKRVSAGLDFLRQRLHVRQSQRPYDGRDAFQPYSKKGEVRAKIATSLINEWKAGALTAMIARAADFYGLDIRNGVPNILVFEPFVKNQKASWLVSDSVPHSYTYTVDAAQSLLTLAESESTWNQTWHVPTTANPPTGKEFIATAATELGVAPKYRVTEQADDSSGGVVQPDGGRILRNALPERFAIPLRLLQICVSLRFLRYPLRRRNSGNRGLF